MTPEELEKELDRLRGDGFERTVIEAYRRALAGRKFVLDNTDKVWWFMPDIGGKKDFRVHVSKRGETSGFVDVYVFYADNNKIYFSIQGKTYEFETYDRDAEGYITATILLDGNKHQLHPLKA